MSQAAFDRGDWQAVIDAHPLESHSPAEWLRYGVAMLQKLEPGPDAVKQQQQAALAFEQARKEGATADELAAAQQQSVLLNMRVALTLVGISLPKHDMQSFFRREVARGQPGSQDLSKESVQAPLSTVPGADGQDHPKDPLRGLVAALARGFSLKLPAEASVLDQLLMAKQQLRLQQVSETLVEDLLRKEIQHSEKSWTDALQKVLLVLRLAGS